MKISKPLGLATAIATLILLGACSSTPIEKAGPESKPSPPPVKPEQKAQVNGDPVAPIIIPAYLDPKNPISQKRSVYFDFDQFVLKPEYTPLLEMHGKFLAAHSNVVVKVQGNTDEQGGAEYNLALGQKRADAVVKALKIYGAKDAQLESVSFGKEKPQATGHDDAARAQNRRADLAYPEK